MKFTAVFQLLSFLLAVSVVPGVVSLGSDHQQYSKRTNGVSSDPTIFGNALNSWTKLSAGWDLTRGNSTGAITLPLPQNGPIIVQPSKTALVIIDMQNFFLHPALGGDPKGRAIVPTTINLIHAFRNAGMPVLWTNWGLTEFDLVNMPPAFIRGFSRDGTSQTSFGSDMGQISVPASDDSAEADHTTSKNATIDVGRLLVRGSWNAQPWGDLFDEQVSGVAKGTDFYLNKNRLSGMWGPGTPMQTWLQDNSMTTLFFGGVNIDQCVWGTLLDSYYKGYDVILVDDVSATTSPDSATQMVDFNARINGWRANSTDFIAALKGATGKNP